jgi:hypothetical protein
MYIEDGWRSTLRNEKDSIRCKTLGRLMTLDEA